MTKYKIIKDCDGNLLYKKEVVGDEHFRWLRGLQISGQRNRDESLVSGWNHVSSIHISRRIDRNFSQCSQYRLQYKCDHCEFTHYYMRTVKEHLKDVHSIDADNNGGEKCCHACKKKYNDLYKANKYSGWDDGRRRQHHWEVCSKIQERAESCIPHQLYDDKENVFDTTLLPIDTRYALFNRFEKSYISNKHVYSECQSRYIDIITTAYHSDIMKGILSHEN